MITRDPRFSLTGYNLHIRDITHADQGDYTCQIGDGTPGDLIHTLEILSEFKNVCVLHCSNLTVWIRMFGAYGGAWLKRRRALLRKMWGWKYSALQMAKCVITCGGIYNRSTCYWTAAGRRCLNQPSPYAPNVRIHTQPTIFVVVAIIKEQFKNVRKCRCNL